MEVYRKPTHMDQYLLFDSHHPLEQKRGVIRTLQHRAESIPTFPEAREQENNHIKQALNKCGYPNWPFIKTHTKQKREVKQLEQRINKFRGEKVTVHGSVCSFLSVCVCVCVCVCERERERSLLHLLALPRT